MYKEPDYQSRVDQITRKIRDPKLKMDVTEVSNAIGAIQNFRAKWNGLSGLITLIALCVMSSNGIIDVSTRPTFVGQNILMLSFGLMLFGMFGITRILLGYIYFFRKHQLLLITKKAQFKDKTDAVNHLKKQDPSAAAIIADIESVK